MKNSGWYFFTGFLVFQSFGTSVTSGYDEILTNSYSFLVQQVTFKIDTPLAESRKKQSKLGFNSFALIGLGHHDNLTKFKRTALPKLKTGVVYVRLDLGIGLHYNSALLIPIMSISKPITGTSRDSGLIHNSEILEVGIPFQFRLLPQESRISMVPMVGHKWLWELAKISDNDDQTPDVLNKKYKDNGLLVGSGSSFRILRKVNSEVKLTFTFVYEFLRNQVQRYRLEWRNMWFDSFEVDSNSRQLSVSEIMNYWSFGVEYISRSGGRVDWYFLGSVSFGYGF